MSSPASCSCDTHTVGGNHPAALANRPTPRPRPRCIATKSATLLGLFAYSAPLSAQSHLSTVQLARRATPATVTILAVDSRGDTVGQGSGFIIASNGIVVTNYHVMAGATSAAVLLSSGERFTAVAALAADPAADVAVIKIPGAGLPTLPTTTALPPVGSRVVAVGSPLGLSQTVTDGIVSARRVVDGRELLQISAPISPGSSGGPVLNEFGAVIAISTSYLQGGQALNFAVPVRYATAILDANGDAFPLSQVFENGSRPEPSPSAPQATPEDLLALAQADSARRMFCATAYLLNNSRAQMDSLLGRANLTKLTSVTASTMSAVLEFFLPKAELHVTQFRLAEVAPPLESARDSVTALLAYVDSLLAGLHQKVNYRRNPSIADLRSTESATFEVATLLDREYVRARLAFESTQQPLPSCLDGRQR